MATITKNDVPQLVEEISEAILSNIDVVIKSMIRIELEAWIEAVDEQEKEDRIQANIQWLQEIENKEEYNDEHPQDAVYGC